MSDLVGFIDEHRDEFGVELMCRSLQMAPSTYYAAKKRELAPSARAVRDAVLMQVLMVLWVTNRKVYGAHKLWKAAVRAGHDIGRDQTARLMRELGIEGISRRRKRVFTTKSDPDALRAPDLVNRQFRAERPDALWVTDITYVPTNQGWCYVATILDLFSRAVVGWAVESTMTATLATKALSMAVQRRRPGAGLLHHSDRGCQYTSTDYREQLRQLGVTVSMSRKGDCWDNAVAESFFATLKRELLNRARWTDSVDVRYAVFEYIETFYNRRRLHSTLGYKTPVQFETEYAAACELAA